MMGRQLPNPWRALRARPDIVLRWADLPDTCGGALAIERSGQLYIVLDNRLDLRQERRSAVTHELIHHERGILPTDAPEAMQRSEEARVRAETARRLVPLDDLRSFVAARCSIDLPVTVHDVAEEFDVTHEVAREACRLAS